MTSCLRRNVALPKPFVEWPIEQKGQIECQTPVTALAAIIGRFCLIRRGSTSSIRSLLDIRNELIEWAEALPPAYDCTRLPSESCKEYPLRYRLIYSDFSIASLWNGYRCILILVNELILDHAQYRDQSSPARSLSTWSSQQKLAEDWMAMSISDICATVPFCLGSDTSTGSGDVAPLGGVSAGVCSTLTWPLYLAASVTRSWEQREWIVKQLDNFGRLVGDRQACLFAEVLRAGGDLTR